MPTSLSSDIIVIATIPSDHPDPSDKCPMYNGRGTQREYNIKQWYDYNIKKRIKLLPNATNKQNWYWFQHTEYYTHNTFIKFIQEIKADKPIPMKRRKPPPKTPSVHTTMANKISNILFKYKYDKDMDILYKILNILSERGASPDIFKEFRIGDCIKTILEIHNVFNRLGVNKSNDSRMIKQTLLSAMIKLKGIDIDNITLIRRISNNQYDHINNKILRNKNMFNENKSLLLYDKEGLEQKTREVYEQRVYDHMDEYLHSSTAPDSNKYKTKKVYDAELDKKVSHPHHHHDGLFKSMHPDWIIRARKDLEMIPSQLPAQSTFDKRRLKLHSYIKKRPKGDYSACQYHFNGKQLLSVLLHSLQHQRIHTCALKNKSITYSINDKLPKYNCACEPCGYCQKLHALLNQKSTDLIKSICCKQSNQSHDFPTEKCLKGNCNNSCGVGYILLCFRSHPKTHTFNNAVLKYDQSEVVNKVKKSLVYGIVTKSTEWTEFIGLFVVDFLKYVIHHMTFIWQYLYKVDMDGMLNQKRLLTHWDYINNPSIKCYKKLNNQWATQNKFAYLAGIETTKLEQEPKQTSINYFIKDPKHDFAAAHHVIKKYCIQKQSEWRLVRKLELEQFRFYSDRGEFLCRGFIFLIAGLSDEIKTNVFWDFGGANHNKDLCDSEGAVSKRCMDDNAESRDLVFRPEEDFVVTAARFCNEYLNSPNRKMQHMYIQFI